MELNRNFQNIVQASEEEKFLFILPSATDVRTLKDLTLIGWCSFKVWLPYSNLPIQNVQKGSATICATASIVRNRSTSYPWLNPLHGRTYFHRVGRID